MKQRILPLQLETYAYDISDFIVAYCNLEAYRAVTCNYAWPADRLLITGESGCGKTHLTKIWQRIHNAAYIENIADLERASCQHVMLENINHNHNEMELLHMLNIATEKKIKILLTMNQYKKFHIPDLLSRITSTYTILIKAPNEDMVKVLVRKMLHNKQVKFSEEILDYISTRLERSFSHIKLFINYLDHLSLIEKRSITIPFVRNILHHLKIYKEEYIEQD